MNLFGSAINLLRCECDKYFLFCSQFCGLLRLGTIGEEYVEIRGNRGELVAHIISSVEAVHKTVHIFSSMQINCIASGRYHAKDCLTEIPYRTAKPNT